MNDSGSERLDVSDPAAASGPAASGRANPGRLGVLSEIAGRLGDDPEAPAALQAVVDGALRATAADEVRLVLRDAGGRGPVAYEAGADGAGGPRQDVPLKAGAARVGVLTLMRSPSREPFADADVLFARTLAEQVATALQAGRRAPEEPLRPATGKPATGERRSPLAALRRLAQRSRDRH